jgi:hypothetical protein
MIKLFNRLLRNCQSENMCNRVLIKLDDWMTPLQFQELLDETVFLDS